MKKEDLSKVSGGMHVFSDVSTPAYYNKNGKGYHGNDALSMAGKERDIIRNMGYEPIQITGNFDTGRGGYVVQKDGIYVDPKDVLENCKNKM